jgi:hypothetical protein
MSIIVLVGKIQKKKCKTTENSKGNSSKKSLKQHKQSCFPFSVFVDIHFNDYVDDYNAFNINK